MTVTAPPAAAPPARRQLAALLWLRWRMVRGRATRAGLLALLALAPLLGAGAVTTAWAVRADLRVDLLLLTPSAYLVLGVLAVVSPVVSGGANDLFPDEQLAAYPVLPRTAFLASLLLAPLDLAWFAQTLTILGLTAYVTGPQPAAAATLLGALAYVATVTVIGQAAAWATEGVRRTRGGRVALRLTAGAAVLAAVLAVQAGLTSTLLDAAPTRTVVTGLVAPLGGSWLPWAAVVAGLAVVAAAAGMLGARAAAWTMRRPGDAVAQPESRHVRRRTPARSAFGELLAVDRASVWRSPALRRGGVVVGLLPGAVAALAALDWSNLVLLPGLVAAGAGLLFGVNVFCLDGPGALWLASLPYPPHLAFLAKAVVLTEFCLAAVAIAVAAGAVRADGAPDASALTALLGATLACVAAVVATCLHVSVTHPHRADLRGRRDTPAPPGAMAVYSVRLAVMTTVLALVFSLLSRAPWPLPAAVAAATVGLSMLSAAQALRHFDTPAVRARVAGTVAAG